jgi:hypothetical protein
MSHQANDELRENQHENAPPALYHVYIHPHGISLNGKEYLLDDAGEVMLFASKDKALKFLSAGLIQVGDLDVDADTLTEDKAEELGYYIDLDLAFWTGDND